MSDVGGTLLYSKLRVYDLQGLCDARIARTLGRDRDLRAFHDYVFVEGRPALIHLTTEEWRRVTRFTDDPRFDRDYAPLGDRLGGDAPARFGLHVYPGQFFVRRDIGLARRLAAGSSPREASTARRGKPKGGRLTADARPTPGGVRRSAGRATARGDDDQGDHSLVTVGSPARY